MDNCYIVLSIVGLLLSCYAVYIEHAKTNDDDYVAFCDINEKISCTSVLNSEYSIGLGIVGTLLGDDSLFNIPSAYYGIVFYCLLMILSFSNMKILMYIKLLLNMVSLIASIFLMYILLFVIEKTCLVCYGIHVTNTGLLVLALRSVCCINNNKRKMP